MESSLRSLSGPRIKYTPDDSPYEAITVDKLTPIIGGEIGGVDLRETSNRQMDEIHRALAENLVIFFRDQHLSQEQHLGRLVRTLDKVVRDAFQLERVVHAERALLARLVDERDRLRLLTPAFLIRHAWTSPCRRGDPGEGSPRRRGLSTRAASRAACLPR